MPNMTIRVPEDLKKKIDSRPEVNWSEVARQSMQEYLSKLNMADEIASQSELSAKDAEELSNKLKRDIAKKYE